MIASDATRGAEQVPRARPGSRQSDLEALRALAALMVFTSHLPWHVYFPDGIMPNIPEWLSPRAPFFGIGGFAVVLFLVISGAALCRLLVLGVPAFAPFARGRLSRLFGQYWIIAIPVLGLFRLLGYLRHTAPWEVLLWLLGLGWLTKESIWPYFGSWWYMGLAWQVVLIAFPLAWALRRWGPLPVLGVSWLVTLAGCAALGPMGLFYAERTLIVARGLEVTAGMMLALELWPDVREKLGVSRRQAAAAIAVAFVGLAALSALGMGGRWNYRAAGVLLTALVVYARPLQRWQPARLSRLAVFVGGISFAFYLVHEPVLVLVRAWAPAASGAPLWMIAAIGFPITVVLAIGATKALERVPWRRLSGARPVIER